MKLVVVGILLYVAQLFLLPFGVHIFALYASEVMADPRLLVIVLEFLLMTILGAIAAYAYARWAHTALTAGSCIALAAVFALMPLFAFLLQLGVAYYVNPLLAVEDLQATIVPLFQSFERGELQVVPYVMPVIIMAASVLLGSYIASFLFRSEAVSKVRILMDDTEGELKL